MGDDAAKQISSSVINIEGRTQDVLSFSGTAADTDALAAGVYDVYSTIDCHIKVDADDASDVTADDSGGGYKLFANNMVTLLLGKSLKIGAIGAAAGKLYYHRVG